MANPEPAPSSDEPLEHPLEISDADGEPLEDLPLLDEAPKLPHRQRPWYPGSIGGFFYLGVLAATAFGVYLVAAHDWRLGVRWEAGALIGAAVVRLVMPKSEAGMLAVRHRLVDCVILGGCGAALLVLAATIPDQPQL